MGFFTRLWRPNGMSNRARRAHPRLAPPRFRPRLEVLEERTLLSSGLTLLPLGQVSGADPISNTNDQPDTQRGTVYYNSTVEPQLAVDPSNPDHAVAVWMQDRWSTGGARALVASATFNASDPKGATWTDPVVIPGISATSGNPDYLRASDPWVSIGPDGTAYVSALSATLGDALPVPRDTAIVTITATLHPTDHNSPIHWGTPHTLIASTSPFPLDLFNDKESITADPNKPGYAYAVWDQLDFPSDQAAFDAYHAGSAIRENLFFSMTADGGKTWTPAQNVTNFQDLKAAFGNQIVVEPDGTLVDVCTIFNGSGSQGLQAGQTTLAVLRSTDSGKTWSAPIIGPALEAIGVTDPDSGAHVRDGQWLLDVTADPNNGNLYAVWADGRFSNFTHEDIAFSMSTDGGLTWSDPIKVNQTPTDLPAGDQQAFTPSVAVAANGTVAVSYYDFRNNTDPTPGSGLPTDYWLVHASGNFTNPAGWQGSEDRLTDTSFNLENAPSAGGLFLGDYQGLSGGGNGGNNFYALFAQAGSDTNPGTSNIWFRDPPPPPSANQAVLFGTTARTTAGFLSSGAASRPDAVRSGGNVEGQQEAALPTNSDLAPVLLASTDDARGPLDVLFANVADDGPPEGIRAKRTAWTLDDLFANLADDWATALVD